MIGEEVSIEDYVLGIMVSAMLTNHEKLHFYTNGKYPNYSNGSINYGFKIYHDSDHNDLSSPIVTARINDKTLDTQISYVSHKDSRGYHYATLKTQGIENIALLLEEKIISACKKMRSRW